MQKSRSLPINRRIIYQALALLLLLLLPFLVFWQVWAPNPADRVMFSGDILMGAYPTRLFVHRLFALDLQPLWNPYQLGGMPVLGDVQIAPYYSFNLLLDWVYRGQTIPYIAFELVTIAHYALGGLLLYGYVRGLGVRSAAALIGAIAFEFNGFFVGHRGHYNMLAVVVWLPGVLWLLDNAWRARRLDGALTWATLAGLALSQLVMAGHPQVTLYCAILIVGYFCYRWLATLRQGRARTWQQHLYTPLLFMLTGTIAAGIAAVALLPALELLSRSLRNTPTYDFAAQYSLLPRNLIGLLMPDFLGWGVTEYRIYAGILTMTLAAVAWLVPARGRPEGRFYTLTALIALVVALGGFTVFHGIIYRFVPGFDTIRVSARAFYFVNFALSILAAFGAEALLTEITQSEAHRLRLLTRLLGALLAVAVLLGTGLYVFLLRDYQPVGEEFFFAENLFNHQLVPSEPFALLTQTANVYLLFVLFLAGSSLLLWARLHNRIRGRALMLALAVLMFVDVATYAPYHDTIKADPETAHFTIKDYTAALLDAPWQVSDQQQLIETLQQVPPYIRVDNSAEILPDNYSMVYQIAFATGYNILDFQERFQLLTQWPYLPNTTRYDLLNTGYVLLPPDTVEPPEEGAILRLSNSQGTVWERATQPDYARFTTQMRPATTSIVVNGLLNLPNQALDAQPTIALDDTKGEKALHDALAEQWPEAVAPALYQIGTSGVAAPVDISVLAGGPIKYSAVIVDGIAVTPEQRGIVLALIAPTTGQLLGAFGYDTYLDEAESERLAATINAAPAGTIVALATYDEGIAKLNDNARQAIASLGTATDLTNQYGNAYAVIGVKGAEAGSVLEALARNAVTLDVGVGALPAPPTVDFTSRLLSYQPTQITLAVQNNVRGLLMVSEAVYPGWQAYIDGVPTPIYRANGLLRAVIVPPIQANRPHEVTFVYTPLSARLGAAVTVSMVTVVASLFLALLVHLFWGRLALWRPRLAVPAT